MLNRLVKENLRSKFVMVSILAGFLAGTQMAAAQVVDDPPGSAFQDQGFRESLGKTATPSVWSRTAARARASGANAYAPGRIVLHHNIVRRRHHS